MKCRRRDCLLAALKGSSYCRLHQPQPALQRAQQPLQQAVTNVQRKRGRDLAAFDDIAVLGNTTVREPSTKRARLSRSSSDDDLGSSPSVVHLPILFLPFEGNYNQRFIGGLAKGVSEVTLFEQGDSLNVTSGPSLQFSDQSFDPHATLGNASWFKGNSSKFTGFSLPSGSAKPQRLSSWKSGYLDIYHASVQNAFDWLCIGKYATFGNGLPKVIVLSEEISSWPATLTVHDHSYNLCSQLSTKSNLQRMAFYLHSHTSKAQFSFRTESRPVSYKGSHIETWGIVTHTSFVSHGRQSSVSIACVHLTSKFTDITSSLDTERQLTTVFDFAARQEVDAVIGDFNLNTYGQLGGTIPLSQSFEYDASSQLGFQSKFSATSGSGEKAYIGGLDVTKAIGVESTLTTSGETLIPPAAELTGKQVLFSDHHGIYKNFVLQ